jgi:hypothetical protein
MRVELKWAAIEDITRKTLVTIADASRRWLDPNPSSMALGPPRRLGVRELRETTRDVRG